MIGYIIGIMANIIYMNNCATEYRDAYTGTDTIQFLAPNVPDRVFFDTDRASLNNSSRDTLNRLVIWLKANPSIKVLIEGHTDETGKNDYNLALGERRANAVKDYLECRGISPDRLSTISYGEDHPEIKGSSKLAYSQNRRALIVVVLD